MRVFISILLAVMALGVGGGVSHGEAACANPTDSAPASEATPAPRKLPFTGFPDNGGNLHIFAAASLTDAYNEIADHLMAQHPNLAISIETAGSQTLVTQLEEGASADILATADTNTMNRAQTSGLIHGDPVIFTNNRLVIVTPSSNPAGIEDIEDLANDGVRLVLANPDVPVGAYSTSALCTYAETTDAPGEFIHAVTSNLASEEPDVRHVLTRVQLGEADAGIVYASDATASILNGVELNVIELPESIPTHVEYPIAPVQGGNTELANAFIAFVLSDSGQEILAQYGFQ